ncbi:MAG: type transport system permease protein [Sphingomonadales bacterium]|jgi:aminopeptidase N|nr:type transport system permease protein [Sphingomonadales bacterium]
MFRRIAAFEFRYQVKNPVFWVAVILFLLLGFALAASPAFPLGGGNVHRNSPVALMRLQVSFNLFYMFVTTAFVANVVVRDDETGFGSIVRSTPITRFQYLIGRFAGAAAAAALAWLVIPIAMWFATLMPWLDPDTLGPNRIGGYAYGILVFGLPDVLITAAIFFAAATLTRSMMWTYVCVIAFFLAWFALVQIAGQRPEYGDWLGIFEPFGAAAIGRTVRYWTPAELNTLLPALNGVLLINRLLWLAIGGAFLALAVKRYRFAEAGAPSRKSEVDEAKERETAASAAEPLPHAKPHSATAAIFWSRMTLEMKQVFRHPAFIVLLALGGLNSGLGLWFGRDIFGTPTLPVAHVFIPILKGSFGLFPIIIAVYYAGELVWRERDRRMHEIVDATAMPDWAYVVPKTAAVALVLIATLLFSMVVAAGIQLAKSWPHFELGKYLLWYLPGMSFDMVAFAVLAVFVQALSPNKYVGWGVMALFIVATIVLPLIGFSHNLYLFPSTPDEPLSGMNGAGIYWIGAWWFRLYWGAFCILLLVASHLLWRRGTETRLMPRLRRLPRRLNGSPGVIAAAALAVFAATGIWIFYNTNILNHYRTSRDQEQFRADYEKKYLKYEKLPQPTVSNVVLNVALYPSRIEAAISGRYVLTNLTAVPIGEIHVRTSPDVEESRIALPASRLKSDDRKFGYRIYVLDRPMQPGETRMLGFSAVRRQRGFRNSGNDMRLVPNGTFLNNFEIAPRIGMDQSALLDDRARRRRYGLPPELRPAKLEDPAATARNYIGVGWTRSDITVSTEADQIPIAPGRKLSEIVADGRRAARFVSDAPILNFFSIQSARYAQRHRLYKGVDLAIYYHPEHDWNVDRMLNALQHAMDYYQANFGPYQFDQVRILEFPGYQSFAQSFANTIPYSESIGFIADTRDADKIDYVTYITAHELGHQWWAHQIVGADAQGSTMLSETLAQYSALMVMKHLYGDDQMRRFLKFELDSYLRFRATEGIQEQPLERVENQQYIHYRKGSLVMYLLQQRLGEAAVNRALRTILDKYKFKGAPYPRSIELVDAFRREAKTPEDQALITDLFERITIYDLKAMAPTAVRRADGKWDVTVPVDARKYYAAGKGEEKEAKLQDRIEIGLFTAMPGRGKFVRSNVVSIVRLPVHSGRQTYRFVTAIKPSYAGIDPYNFYIDRNSSDNVAPVS